MATFDISGDQFRYEGKPLRILSGAIHYFRVVPDYWKDRLLKLKACGFNTVETYVPWNVHEPRKGEFRFEGMADLESFARLAGELGLHVIVRPSPYICAEWEFGGLPAWLLEDANVRLRSCDPAYLRHVDDYYDELLPRLKPLLCTSGGPIVAMQVENEYGSYGSDKAYLEYLREAMVRRGMDVLLFTSDGPEDHMLQGGTIDGVLATVNFGSDPAGAFRKLREYRPEGPLMCMEFWNGWFDHWMEEHQTRPAGEVADALDELLKEGASVNFYMFHGGTNFGFLNGANHIKRYEPTVNSYDYDTLLGESGEPTAKFFAVREVLERHFELPPLVLPEPIARRSYGPVKLKRRALLLEQLEALSAPISRANPEPMERLGQAYGYILYSARVTGPTSGMSLTIQEVRDRALVFADGRYVGVVERWNPAALPLEVPAEGVRLDILVENMGRVNYGPLLRDPKGITEGVRLDNQFIHGWTIYPLPMESLEGLEFTSAAEGETGADSAGHSEISAASGPAFYQGVFEAEEAADTFLRLDGWTKGNVFLNGFHLGRYWNAGPTRTLYVPAPLLKKGINELIVFELHGTQDPVVLSTDTPDLG
ncbi:beta-galactosidase [Cohnella thailandensis]|uniref:Beta-galactosidase n=1 Tax=Cohnella thailandensis TaxID=557557 RepID=A0A841SY15_9BACL|nr:beta-galactosidase [Cohnella thailandensis]MBP1977059.1 beta-galactosidase [Cohnella thailandensis]